MPGIMLCTIACRGMSVPAAVVEFGGVGNLSASGWRRDGIKLPLWTWLQQPQQQVVSGCLVAALLPCLVMPAIAKQ